MMKKQRNINKNDFNSIKTYKNLKFLNLSDCEFDYSTYQQIDKKFNTYTEEYQKNYQKIPKHFKTIKFQSEESNLQQQRNTNQEQQTYINQIGIKRTKQNFMRKPHRLATKTILSRNKLQNKSMPAINNFENSKDNYISANQQGNQEQQQLQNTLNKEEQNQAMNCLKNLLIQQIKLNVKDNIDNNSQISNLFGGNPFIASFIQSLIMKIVEETFNIKLKTYKQMLLKLKPDDSLIKEFDINPLVLQNLVSIKDRRNYVVNCLQENLQFSMQKFVKNQKLKEQSVIHLLQLTKYFHQTQSQNIKELGNLGKRHVDYQDTFQWLKVNSKYENLQKKLRTILIQNLNYFENQVIIEQAMKKNLEYKQLKSQDQSLQQNQQNLIANPSTISSQNQLAIKEKKLALAQRPQSQNPRIAKTKLQNILSFPTRSILENMNSKWLFLIKPKRYKVVSQSQQQIQIKKEKDLNQTMQDTIWDASKENVFLSKRNQCAKMFINELGSSSYNQLGFSPVVQQINLDQQKIQKRTFQLEKYMNGDFLTAPELKFLADTSELLNKCIDKNYIQNAVDLLDDEVIHNIELHLAESIIQSFESSKKEIFYKRTQFLKNNLDQRKQLIQNFEKKFQRKKEYNENIKFIQKKKKLLSNICKKMEGEHQFQDKSPQFGQQVIKLVQKKQQNIKYQKSLDKKVQLENEIKEEAIVKFKDAIENQYASEQYLNQKLSNCTELLQKKIQKEIQRRKYHPSSKIFCKKQYTLPDYINTKLSQSRLKQIDYLQKDFELFLKDSYMMKSPKNFISFYSCGPNNSNNFSKLYDMYQDKFNASPQDIAKIIKIQTIIRGFIVRRKYKDILKTINSRKTTHFEQILNRMFEYNFNVGEYSLKNKKENEIENKFKNSRRQSILQKLKQDFYQIQNTHQKLNQNKKQQQSHYEYLELMYNTSKVAMDTKLKHKKLLDCAQKNFFNNLRQSGFNYNKQDVNIYDSEGNTPLYYTALNKNMNFCQYLLDKGANVNAICSNNCTPLHIAFQSNNYNMIMMFLQFPCNLDIIDNDGHTALAYANNFLLQQLGLICGISSIELSQQDQLNNNSLLFQNVKQKLEDFVQKQSICFQHYPLQQSTTSIRQVGQQYNEPQIVSYQNI